MLPNLPNLSGLSTNAPTQPGLPGLPLSPTPQEQVMSNPDLMRMIFDNLMIGTVDELCGNVQSFCAQFYGSCGEAQWQSACEALGVEPEDNETWQESFRYWCNRVRRLPPPYSYATPGYPPLDEDAAFEVAAFFREAVFAGEGEPRIARWMASRYRAELFLHGEILVATFDDIVQGQAGQEKLNLLVTLLKKSGIQTVGSAYPGDLSNLGVPKHFFGIFFLTEQMRFSARSLMEDEVRQLLEAGVPAFQPKGHQGTPVGLQILSIYVDNIRTFATPLEAAQETLQRLQNDETFQAAVDRDERVASANRILAMLDARERFEKNAYLIEHGFPAVY